MAWEIPCYYAHVANCAFVGPEHIFIKDKTGNGIAVEQGIVVLCDLDGTMETGERTGKVTEHNTQGFVQEFLSKLATTSPEAMLFCCYGPWEGSKTPIYPVKRKVLLGGSGTGFAGDSVEIHWDAKSAYFAEELKRL